MSIAVVPGSFDPVTLGHLDVFRRAANLFDEVVVAVAVNPGKEPLLPVDVRVDLLEKAVVDVAGLRVVEVEGLLVDLCRQVGATAIVKGLRSGADYDDELPMARMNRHLGVETLFLPADPAVAHIASSLVKDIARHGGLIDDLVPSGVADVVRDELT